MPVSGISDVAALIKLLRDTIAALDESRGLPAQYQRNIETLEQLKQIFRQAETQFDPTKGPSVSLHISEYISDLAHQGRPKVEECLDSIQKYAHHLGKRQTEGQGAGRPTKDSVAISGIQTALQFLGGHERRPLLSEHTTFLRPRARENSILVCGRKLY